MCCVEAPAAVCLRELYGGDKTAFTDDLEAYLLRGYVVSTPDVFAMARPVCRGWPLEWIADVTREPENPDTWFIWQATGNLQLAIKLFPFPLTFIGAGRRGRPVFHRMNRFLSLTESLHHVWTFRKQTKDAGRSCCASSADHGEQR